MSSTNEENRFYAIDSEPISSMGWLFMMPHGIDGYFCYGGSGGNGSCWACI